MTLEKIQKMLESNIVCRQLYESKDFWPSTKFLILSPNSCFFTEGAIKGQMWSNYYYLGDKIATSFDVCRVPKNEKIQMDGPVWKSGKEKDKETNEVGIFIFLPKTNNYSSLYIQSIANRELAINRGIQNMLFGDYLTPKSNIMIDIPKSIKNQMDKKDEEISDLITDFSGIAEEKNSIPENKTKKNLSDNWMYTKLSLSTGENETFAILPFRIEHPIKKQDDKSIRSREQFIQKILSMDTEKLKLFKNAIWSLNMGYENSADNYDYINYWFGLEAISNLYSKESEDSSRIGMALTEALGIKKKGIIKAFKLDTISEARDDRVHNSEHLEMDIPVQECEALLRILILKSLNQEIPKEIIDLVKAKCNYKD